MRGLSLVATSGGHSSSRCAGLSLSRPLLLRSTGSRRAGSVVVAHGSSCSAACGIFPDQGSEPVCPALAGGFSTTAPPGKPWFFSSNKHSLSSLYLGPSGDSRALFCPEQHFPLTQSRCPPEHPQKLQHDSLFALKSNYVLQWLFFLPDLNIDPGNKAFLSGDYPIRFHCFCLGHYLTDS